MAAKKKSSPRNTSKKTSGSKRPAKLGATTKKAAAARGAGASRKKAGRRGAPTGGDEALPTDLLDLRAIEHLSRLMESTGLQEIEVQDGPDRMLRLSRRAGGDSGSFMYSAPAPAAAPVSAPEPASVTAPSAAAANEDIQDFASPMVGTFYRASGPEASSYVSPGDKVNPDTVLCIIEAMKVMNEVRAEVSGEIVDVLVENGEAVEYGQPLFHIRTSR